MINPKDITNFERTEEQLQEFLLFCVIVAGKNSHIQSIKLHSFLSLGHLDFPFETIRTMISFGSLRNSLEKVKMGQYSRIEPVFVALVNLNKSLKEITLEDLESIKGIGPKTSRFFLLHSRPNQNIAVLDTHILKALKERGIPHVPKSTPSGKRYAYLERSFLMLCAENGKKPSEFDLELWREKNKS